MVINHLSEIMGRQRVSIRRVARETGLAINTVGSLYNDESKRVDLETLDKLCAYLGVGIGDILEHKKEQEGEG